MSSPVPPATPQGTECGNNRAPSIDSRQSIGSVYERASLKAYPKQLSPDIIVPTLEDSVDSTVDVLQCDVGIQCNDLQSDDEERERNVVGAPGDDLVAAAQNNPFLKEFFAKHKTLAIVFALFAPLAGGLFYLVGQFATK